MTDHPAKTKADIIKAAKELWLDGLKSGAVTTDELLDLGRDLNLAVIAGKTAPPAHRVGA